MIKGVYAAGLSVLNKDLTVNIDATINHAENLIKNGLHGVFFYGSTGMSQLVGLEDKKKLISKISNHKLKKQFFLGTGNNSLQDNIELIDHGFKNKFETYLLMPPAYYPKTDQGVFNFYQKIISTFPKIIIGIYNFEKLCGYKFSVEAITRLVKNYPNNIRFVKDSSYNLFQTLNIKDLLVFPGSETKLKTGLDNGCSGSISAVLNVTHSLARKVFDDFSNKKDQTDNEKLIKVRETFDKYQLISALHTYLSIEDEKYKNLLPPLVLLSEEKKLELLSKLKELNFLTKKNIAA
jgi:4-hydroxy-tetrahydrodipicolinate synthase|tara:strand:- start:404 stop:1282 length:879 start_codon:yes stop_codon:yes gene_type:complete